MIEPGRFNGYAVDLQSRFESPDGSPVELGQTNFGFLGVRVAKTMSEQFGGGGVDRCASDRAARRRSAARQAAGSTIPGRARRQGRGDLRDGPSRRTPIIRRAGMLAATAGSEHRSIATRPTAWRATMPFCLRYRLLVHSGHADADVLNPAWEAFALSPAYVFDPAARPDRGGAQARRGGELTRMMSLGNASRQTCRRPNSFSRWSLDSLRLCGKCGNSAGFSPRSILFFSARYKTPEMPACGTRP